MSSIGLLSLEVINSNTRVDSAKILMRSSYLNDGSLEILVTEGSNAYSALLSETDIRDLLKGDRARWPAEFRKLVLHGGSDLDMDLVAVLHDEKVVLLIRECAEIPLKICSIDIKLTDAEISLFDWASELAVQIRKEHDSCTSSDKELQRAKSELQEGKHLLKSAQRIKNEHEEAVMQKFCILINTKKNKIRHLMNTGSLTSSAGKKVSPERRRRPSSSCQRNGSDPALGGALDVCSLNGLSDDVDMSSNQPSSRSDSEESPTEDNEEL